MSAVELTTIELKFKTNVDANAAKNVAALKDALHGLNGISVDAQLSSQIAAIASAMTSLKSAKPTPDFIKNMDALGNSFQKLSALGGNVTSLAGVANALNSLNGIKINKNFTDNVSALVNQVGKLNSVGSNLGGVKTLAEALVSLNGIKISSTLKTGMDSVIQTFSEFNNRIGNFSGLSALGDALNKINNIKINQTIGTQIPRIANSFKSLKDVEPIDERVIKNFEVLGDAIAACGSKISHLSTEQLNAISAGLKSTSSSAEKTTISLKSLSAMASNVRSKLMLIRFAVNNLVGAFAGIYSAYGRAVDATRTFSSAMGSGAKSAYDYAAAVENAYGINKYDWMEHQQVFMSIGRSMGFTQQSAENLSKTMTQLGYDYAAYFDSMGVDTETAFRRIQSALTGQVQGIKLQGVDVSVGSLNELNDKLNTSEEYLQEIAVTRGFDKPVKDMNNAEKAALRVTAMFSQLSHIIGETGRSLNDPASQIRILNANVQRLKIAFGALAVPLITRLIPVLIAIIQLLSQAATWIAGLFGVKLPVVDWKAWNNLNTAAGGAEDASEGIADNMGEADKAAKELKKTINGIDEVYTIDDKRNDTSGGGGGGIDGGGGGGSDFAFPDDLWGDLGGTTQKQIDAIKKKIMDLLPYVEAIATAFGFWKISSSIAKFFSGIGSGITALGKFSFGTALISEGLERMSKAFSALMKGDRSVETFADLISGLTEVVSGFFLFKGDVKKSMLFLAISSISGLVADISRFAKGDFSMENIIQTVKDITMGVGSIAVLLGNTQLGAVMFGINGIVSLIDTISDIKEKGFNPENIKHLFESALKIISAVVFFLMAVKGKDILGGVKNLGKTKTAVKTATDAAGEIGSPPQAASKMSVPSWQTLAKVFAVIVAAIVIVVGTVLILSLIDTSTLQRGATNAQIIGEGFTALLLPVIAITVAITAIALVVSKFQINPAAIAAGFVIVLAAIAACALAIGLLGLFETAIFAKGAINAKYIGEGIDALLIPVGIVIVAALALGALMVLTEGIGVAIIAAGFVVILAAIAECALAIGLLGKVDSALLLKGSFNAKLIGDALDALAIPIGIVIAAALAIGTVIVGTAGIAVLAIEAGLKEMNHAINVMAKEIVHLSEIDTGALMKGSFNAKLIGDALDALAPPITMIIKSAKILGSKLADFLGFGTDALEKGMKSMIKVINVMTDSVIAMALKSNGVNTGSLVSIGQAIDSFIEISNKMPKSGGIAQWFTGSTDIEKFGKQMVGFAQKIAEFSTAAGGVSLGNIYNLKVGLDTTNSMVAADYERYAAYGKALSSFGKDIQTFSNGIVTFDPSKISNIKLALEQVINGFNGFNFAGLAATIKNEIQNVVNGLKGFSFAALKNAIFSQIETDVKSIVFSTTSELNRKNLENALNSSAGYSFVAVSKKIYDETNKVISTLNYTTIANVYKTKMQDAINALAFTFSVFPSKITSALTTALNDVNYSTLANIVKDKLTNAVNSSAYSFNIASKLQSALSSAANGVSYASVGNAISSGVRNAANNADYGSVGRNIIYGIVDGLYSELWYLISSTQNIMNQIPYSAKKALGIASPSKVFMKIGDYIGQGLAIGGINSVENAAADIANTLDSEFSNMDVAIPEIDVDAAINFDPEKIQNQIASVQTAISPHVSANSSMLAQTNVNADNSKLEQEVVAQRGILDNILVALRSKNLTINLDGKTIAENVDNNLNRKYRSSGTVPAYL